MQTLTIFCADIFAAICKLCAIDVYITSSEDAEGNLYLGPVHSFWEFGYASNDGLRTEWQFWGFGFHVVVSPFPLAPKPQPGL